MCMTNNGQVKSRVTQLVTIITFVISVSNNNTVKAENKNNHSAAKAQTTEIQNTVKTKQDIPQVNCTSSRTKNKEQKYISKLRYKRYATCRYRSKDNKPTRLSQKAIVRSVWTK